MGCAEEGGRRRLERGCQAPEHRGRGETRTTATPTLSPSSPWGLSLWSKAQDNAPLPAPGIAPGAWCMGCWLHGLWTKCSLLLDWVQDGWTPLHVAATGGREELLRALIHLGANPNAKTQV